MLPSAFFVIIGIMIDRLNNHFAFQQTALALRQERQEVLASNIANADTPNYKARDFDFSQALENALAPNASSALGPTHLSLTSARHIPGAAYPLPSTHLKYRQPMQPALDGNTVEMDVERMAFAENTMQYQTSLSLISQRIKGLTAALQQG